MGRNSPRRGFRVQVRGNFHMGPTNMPKKPPGVKHPKPLDPQGVMPIPVPVLATSKLAIVKCTEFRPITLQ